MNDGFLNPNVIDSLTRNQLKRLNEEQHEDFVLINVLPAAAFNERHIRTSINIPYKRGDFIDRVEQVAGTRDRKIVVYYASFECDA